MSPILPRLMAGRAGLSEGAREYRRAMWLSVLLGAAGEAARLLLEGRKERRRPS